MASAASGSFGLELQVSIPVSLAGYQIGNLTVVGVDQSVQRVEEWLRHVVNIQRPTLEVLGDDYHDFSDEGRLSVPHLPHNTLHLLPPGTFNWPLRISSVDGQQARDIEATMDTGSAYTTLVGGELRSVATGVSRAAP